MKTTTENPDMIKKVLRQEDAHPDASDFIQNHPDARGFAPGKQSTEPNGLWHSHHADAHGWCHSSTK
ncbi:MAG: hypothetical protein ACKUBY_01460 [Candidatus Moraniibacteriota bacterium]|jgi:hypothetical protein